MASLKKILHVVIGLSGLVAVWQIVVWIGGFNEALFPPPLKVWKTLIEMLRDGSIFVHLKISLYRFLVGYLTAVVIAVLLGLILGRMKRLWAVIDPVVQVLRPVSPIAWSPIIILFFSMGTASAIVIIFIAAFYPVLLSTVSAVRKVEPVYLKVAQNFEVRQPWLMTKIILPTAFPQITNGLHIALGTAWVFLVSGEMVGAQSGLGYLIVDGRNTFRIDWVFVAILVIGLTGMLLDRCIHLFERWVERQWGQH